MRPTSVLLLPYSTGALLLTVAAAVAGASVISGCAHSVQAARGQEQPVNDASTASTEEQDGRPGEVIQTTGAVVLSSFALAGHVTYAGARAVGGAIGGLFRGGRKEASRTWNMHAEHTRDLARRQAAHVSRAAKGGSNETPETKQEQRQQDKAEKAPEETLDFDP